MSWHTRFDLFLFDFDGLLVNTERLHYLAYIEMCKAFGCTLSWTFEQFCERAHFSSDGIHSGLQKDLPQLFVQGRDWKELYNAKKRAYLSLLQAGKVELMPGVKELLMSLATLGTKRCVVTHSPKEQVEIIVKQIPLLSTIKRWILREDYTHPKPHPEGYQKALQELCDPKDRVIGFEDTYRGLQALKAAEVERPVVISSVYVPENGIAHFPTFSDIPPNWGG